MFDIFDSLLALSEVEYNGKKYLRLKTITVHKGVETVLVVKANTKLPATVQLIQLETAPTIKKGQR